VAIVQAILGSWIARTPGVVPEPSNGGAPALGKFGWKAQVPCLFVFSVDVYLNEMGVTNPLFPDENCPQGDCDSLRYNPALTSPNDDGSGLQRLNAFVTVPPPRPRCRRSVV